MKNVSCITDVVARTYDSNVYLIWGYSSRRKMMMKSMKN